MLVMFVLILLVIWMLVAVTAPNLPGPMVECKITGLTRQEMTVATAIAAAITRMMNNNHSSCGNNHTGSRLNRPQRPTQAPSSVHLTQMTMQPGTNGSGGMMTKPRRASTQPT